MNEAIDPIEFRREEHIKYMAAQLCQETVDMTPFDSFVLAIKRGMMYQRTIGEPDILTEEKPDKEWMYNQRNNCNISPDDYPYYGYHPKK